MQVALQLAMVHARARWAQALADALNAHMIFGDDMHPKYVEEVEAAERDMQALHEAYLATQIELEAY